MRRRWRPRAVLGTGSFAATSLDGRNRILFDGSGGTGGLAGPPSENAK